MARKKINQQEVNTQEAQAQEVQAVQEVPKEEVNVMTTKLERANRITINAVEDGYRADFYRTHKKLTTILSQNTGWEINADMNKSAQREDFRQYAITHADVFGIEWKPQDMRSDVNKRYAKYETDDMLIEDAINMLRADIETLISKTSYGVSLQSIEIDEIVPVTHSAKGTDLTKLGVIDGKYEKSGNWAWADIAVIVTMNIEYDGGCEIYFSTKCQLVSGQLKKPHITQTAFNEDLKVSLLAIGAITEEVKEEESK